MQRSDSRATTYDRLERADHLFCAIIEVDTAPRKLAERPLRQVFHRVRNFSGPTSDAHETGPRRVAAMAWGEPAGTADDEAFLDDVYAAILHDTEQARAPDAGVLCEERPDLARRAEYLMRIACTVSLLQSWPAPMLPGYQLVSRIGIGGMGEVFLCRQLGMGGRLLAVKIPPKADNSRFKLHPSARGAAVSQYRTALRWQPFGTWSDEVREELKVVADGDMGFVPGLALLNSEADASSPGRAMPRWGGAGAWFGFA